MLFLMETCLQSVAFGEEPHIGKQLTGFRHLKTVFTFTCKLLKSGLANSDLLKLKHSLV